MRWSVSLPVVVPVFGGVGVSRSFLALWAVESTLLKIPILLQLVFLFRFVVSVLSGGRLIGVYPPVASLIVAAPWVARSLSLVLLLAARVPVESSLTRDAAGRFV